MDSISVPLKRAAEEIEEALVGPAVEEVEIVPVTIQSAVKRLNRLEQLAITNQEQRHDHPKEPQKFLNSEAEINDILNWFLGLGTAELPVLKELGALMGCSLEKFYEILLPLLSHPNSDIGNSIVAILHEVFHDEDGIKDAEKAKAICNFAVRCLNSDLFLLFNNHIRSLLKTGNGTDTNDNQAIFQILEVAEDIFNVFQIERDDGKTVVFYDQLASSNLFCLLVEMFQQDPKLVKTASWSNCLAPGDYANRLYAAELCATILQLSATDLTHQNEKVAASIITLLTMLIDGIVIIEAILVSLSVYRQRDPVDSDEQEYMFNLFDALGALLLNSHAARISFCSDRCEGIQLFQLFLKETNMARIRAIQILDYALSSDDQNQVTDLFISLGGLKVLSPILLGKGLSRLTKNYPKLLICVDPDESHICAIFCSLLKNSAMDSTNYFRIMAKFAESNGEKFNRMLELHEKYQDRVNQFDFQHPQDSDDADIWLLDRMNAGLFTLNQIDISLLILSKHAFIFERIRGNESSASEIEQALFDAVEAECNSFLKLDPLVLAQVGNNVNGHLSQLVESADFKIYNELKSWSSQ